MARSGVIYGPTGSFKTTQIKRFAHYIANKTGKSTLLLSLDGGGWAPCEPEVQAGMIEPYRCETATLPLPILRNISRGYWPADPNETRPERINLIPINWDKFGGIAIEGWTSIGTVISRYLCDQGISVGGEDRNKANANMMFTQPIHLDGAIVTEKFGSTTRGDYKFIQNTLHGLVTNLGSLPCEYVLHTALESKTEDDDRSTIYGPSIEGKKGTSQCGAWVGDQIHAQDYAVPVNVEVDDPNNPGKKIAQTLVETRVRFFFMKHPDPVTGIMFPAKPRVAPEKMGELAKRFPGGYFEPTADGRNGFDAYLELLDTLQSHQSDQLKGWRERCDAKLGRGPKAATAPSDPTPINASARSAK